VSLHIKHPFILLPIVIRTLSPDPVLTGVLIAQTVQGIQSAGVIACAKHYIGNEQEHFRQAPEATGYGYKINEASSSNIDDATMHELYLWYVWSSIPQSHRADTFEAICRCRQSRCRFNHVLIQSDQQ